MEKIILYVDDAAYARQFLAGLTREGPDRPETPRFAPLRVDSRRRCWRG